MEMPIMWGGNMVLDLGLYLKIGPIRVVVPIHVSGGSSCCCCCCSGLVGGWGS